MRLTRRLLYSFASEITEYASRKQTPTTLAQMMTFGKVTSLDRSALSAKFLLEELPIRLAHMTKEVESLPTDLLKTPSVQRVHSWYLESFRELTEFSVAGLSKERLHHDFNRMCSGILDRHAPVVLTMAHGILEFKSRGGNLNGAVQYFLDRFYMSRIGIRMLIGQHLELFGEGGSGAKSKTQTYVGIIAPSCNPQDIALDAADTAKFRCHQTYLCAPDVEVVTPQLKYRNGGAQITFPYVPSHLYHILFEVIKNSMRAVVEHHTVDAVALPPVRVEIVKGDQEDITIKVSDRGGGIPRSNLPLLYTYMYTTASTPMLSEDEQRRDMNHAPLAGFGYGLPLSRLYARYFGGDLQVLSMEGHSTDAYIYLKKAADESGEVLPQYRDQELNRYTHEYVDWMQPS